MSEPYFWRGKKVFVTGHTGFKGSWLCKILEMAGADTTGYALEPPARPNLFDVRNPDACSVIGDIRDFDALFEAFEKARPEIVIHMAAQPLVLDSYQMPRYTYDVNVMGAVNILECARQYGKVKSLLNVTTDKVYFNEERSRGYREEEALNGFDPYSNSKSCSELVTLSYYNAFFKDAGVSVSTARSGNVIGGGDFSANRLIPDCARALAAGERIEIRNPDSIRPYLHVLDTLFAYLRIAEAQYEEPSISGAYNIGPDADDCATNGRLADLFCGAWGCGAGWERISVDNPYESGTLTLDCSKIKRVFGWTPRWSLEKAIMETALWYRAYFKGADCDSLMAGQIKEFMPE